MIYEVIGKVIVTIAIIIVVLILIFLWYLLSEWLGDITPKKVKAVVVFSILGMALAVLFYVIYGWL